MIYSSISAPFFTEYIAKITKGKHVKWSKLLSSQYRNSKVFMLGLYFPENPFWQKVSCKKMLIVWSGSDVIRLKKLKSSSRDNLLSLLEKKNYRFASNGVFLKKEMDQLYKFKRSVENVKLPSRHDFSNLFNMPDKFSVGVYIPDGNNKGFYGYNVIIEVVKRLKEIDFYFYNLKGYVSNKEEKQIKNLKCVPSAISDMPSFMKKISCGVRVTDHDAASMTAVEYNMAGRWFIFNHDMKYCIKVSHKPSVDEVADRILEVKKNKYNMINNKGEKFYKKEHSVNNFLSTINGLL